MQPSENKPKPLSPWAAYALVGEIGYMIAIPAVLFGVGGAYLDRYLATFPIFMGIGLSVAFITSAMGIVRIIKRVQKMTEKR